MNRPPPTRPRPRSGFTLIEVALVLLILGLLAGAATLRLVPMLRTTTLEDAVRRIEGIDRSMRSRAVSSGARTTLHFEMEEACVFYTEGTEPARHGLQRFPQCHIEAVRLDGKVVTEGEVSVACSPAGISSTYAVRITGPDGRVAWIVVAALGGSVQVFDGKDAEKNVDAVFAALVSAVVSTGGGRDDTH